MTKKNSPLRVISLIVICALAITMATLCYIDKEYLLMCLAIVILLSNIVLMRELRKESKE